jgi:hypothetical protein
MTPPFRNRPSRGRTMCPSLAGQGLSAPRMRSMKALPILGVASIALLAVPLAHAFPLG